MFRRVVIVFWLCSLGLAWADTDVSGPDAGDNRQETTSDQEWEAKRVIPPGGLTVSTQPITPITILPDRNPADQALVELALAQDLVKKGNTEAASDVALQAYDDLMGAHMPRRTNKNKKKRQKLREERHQAATVYIDSSIAYIQEYVKKGGDSRRVQEEGRARLGDLRDVAQNYPELARKLNKAMEPFAVVAAVDVSSPTTP